MKPLGVINRLKLKLKFLKLNYDDIKMIDNREVPKFLDVYIKNGILYFIGTPEAHDLGEYKFVIIDK